MTSADAAAMALIDSVGMLAQCGGRQGITGTLWDRHRTAMQGQIMDLRDALMPVGDPLFVQVPHGRRAWQILALAGEHWMRRGMLTTGESWSLLCAASNACGAMIQEQTPASAAIAVGR